MAREGGRQGAPGGRRRTRLRRTGHRRYYDADHVGGFGRIDGLDAPVYGGEPDASYLDGTATPPALSKKGSAQRRLGVGMRHPAAVSRVADGEEVGGFTCFHTPGHTPGHVAYVHEELSVALLGDLVRPADGAFEPVSWFVSDDTAAADRSVRSLVERAPAFDVGVVGHGAPIVSGAAQALHRCVNR